MDYKEKVIALLNSKELSKEQKEKLEGIFPELKESEDERIRKALIRFHKSSIDIDGIKGDDILAWLEKQGDKDKLIKELGEYKVKYTQEVLEKHINSMSNKDDERLRKTTIAFLKDFAEQGYENAVECIDWLEKQGTSYTKRDVDNAFVEGMAFAKNELEKQGKQKPIDKIQLGKKYKCIASPRYSTFRRGNIYKPVDNFLCNLMNLCYECFEPIEDGELKPAENSQKVSESSTEEKDMTEYKKGFECGKQRVLKYPQDFNLQPKQEWSEEDEKIYNLLYEEYKNVAYYSRSREKAEDIPGEVLGWLKSLKDRYTWKPSDEQMKALHDLNLTGGISYAGQGQVLIELYNDLKKLKE